jgi:hypothetical protein
MFTGERSVEREDHGTECIRTVLYAGRLVRGALSRTSSEELWQDRIGKNASIEISASPVTVLGRSFPTFSEARALGSRTY